MNSNKPIRLKIPIDRRWNRVCSDASAAFYKEIEVCVTVISTLTS